MASDELSVLESKIDELIGLCHDLARENRALKDRTSSWATERADLVGRNERAKAKIEAMIDRLKSLDAERAT